jgi:hypothetical protein
VEQTDIQPSPVKPWYRKKRYAIPSLVMGLFLVAMVLLTFVPTSKDSPLGAGLKLQATTIQSSNSMSSGYSTHAGEKSLFLCRHIALINRSDHPLMQGVQTLLAEKLQAVMAIDQLTIIDTNTPNPWHEDGQLAPDMYLTLDMPQFKESGLLVTGRDIQAQITVHFSQQLGNSSSGYSDDSTPPIVRINANMELDHKSTSKGYESANATYECVIKDITEQLSQSIIKLVSEKSAEYASDVQIPDALFPAYKPVIDNLPLPDHATLKKLCSNHDLMRHNRTTWHAQPSTPEESAVMFEKLHQQYKDANWKISEYNPRKDENSGSYLRAFKDRLMVEVFEVRKDYKIAAGKPVDAFMRYTEPMDRSQLKAVYEQLLADDALSMTSWLYFYYSIPRKIRGEFADRFMTQGAMPVEVELKIIEHLKSSKRTDEAIQRLEKVSAVALIMDKNKWKKPIEKLGRELTGNQKWQAPPLTESCFEHAGIPCIAVGEEITQTVKLGQRVLWYDKVHQKPEKPDEFVVVSTVITSATIPEGKYEHAISVQMKDGSTRSSSTQHNPPTPWNGAQHATHGNHSWIVNAREVKDGEIELKIKCQEQELPKTKVTQPVDKTS